MHPFLLLIITGIISFIILYIKSKEENQKIKTPYKEKKKKGETFENYIADYYESLGYSVERNGIKKGKKDEGIDIIASNPDEILLIQCKNYNPNTKWKIRDKDIKAFRINCIDYVEKHNIDKSKVSIIYITSDNIFHPSAIKYIEEKQKEGKRIKYKIIPF